MAGVERDAAGSMIRRAATGFLAGLWAALVLTLYDFASIGADTLPWAGAWSYLGERLLVGALFYALPFSVLLSLGSVLAGILRGGGRAGSRPVPAAAGQAVTLLLVYVAMGIFATRSDGTVWLTAPWILEVLILLLGCSLAGWSAGRAARWACRRAAPGPALALLALLPVLPALPALPGVMLEAGSPWPARPEPRAAAMPDIIVIVADTLRADRVNGPRAAEIMPVITRLAARGIRFEEATAQSSWTNPSTATILTGLLPVDHGMRGYTGRIGPEVTTLAEMLEAFGYQTAGIAANPLISSRFGFDQGFHHWDEEPGRGLLTRHGFTFASRFRRAMGQGPPVGGIMKAGEVTDRALEILREPRERPLFLYLHYMDPHDPYEPPPWLETSVDPNYQGSLRFEANTLYQILRGEIEVDERDLQHARTLYDAEITYMDREIGRLFHEISSAFDGGAAVVAFTSDHGEEFMEHGALDHGHTLYQELINVPLIVARPGHLEEGLVVSRPVSHLDLIPTLLEAAGLSPRGILPGGSLVSRVAGVAVAEPSILSEEDYTGYRAASHRMRSIREGDLKVILYEPNVFGIGPWRREIFDLARDPGEALGMPSVPEEAAGLMERLMAWKERSSVAGMAEGPLDPEMRERLKALGYIQ